MATQLGLGDVGAPSMRPLDHRVENVFFEAHSLIRDIDGLHPEEALDQLLLVMKAKILDEARIGTSDSVPLYRSRFDSSELFSDAIRKVLRTQDLTSQAPSDTDLTLSADCLSQVFATFESYSISLSAVDVRGRAFQRVIDSAARAGMGQYLTPTPIVDFMIGAIRPGRDERLIDPFSGSGHFLTQSPPPKPIGAGAGDALRIGVEKSSRMIRVAEMDSFMAGVGGAVYLRGDTLADFGSHTGLRAGSYDVVLTNPPFGSLLGAEITTKFPDLELANRKGSTPLEILGLERTVQLLKPGGRFGIVLPEGMLSNQRLRHVREWLLQRTVCLGIVGLPSEAFSPFGANVRAVVVFGRRKWPGEETGDYQVTVAEAESIGYDASGRPNGRNDLLELEQVLADAISTGRA